jgi:hypothetical protein
MTMLAGIGRSFLSFLAMMGAVSTFAGRAFFHAFAPPIYWRLLGKQLIAVGYFSLPVVGLTALFTGAVLARQIYIGTGRIGAESAVPTIVVFSITRELGPVIASLMVAGRVSSNISLAQGYWQQHSCYLPWCWWVMLSALWVAILWPPKCWAFPVLLISAIPLTSWKFQTLSLAL